MKATITVTRGTETLITGNLEGEAVDLYEIESRINAINDIRARITEVEEPERRELTKEEQAKLLTDFAAWSGGYNPIDCGFDQIQTYVTAAVDSKLHHADILDFLTCVYDGVTYPRPA